MAFARVLPPAASWGRLLGRATPPRARVVSMGAQRKAPAAPGNGKLVEKAKKIGKVLSELYPQPPIPLNHESRYQLLVAVILSAQSTDKKVNECTPALFAAAPDAKSMVDIGTERLQNFIRQIGLAPTKARNITKMSEALLDNHGGEVPGSFEELEALAGVGHKTASVVLSQAFGVPALAVDTHVHRLAQRWGLSNGKSVEKTEEDLKRLFPEESWRDLSLQMIYFGREHCPAKKHDRSECPICNWAAEGVEPQPASPKGAAAAKGKKRQAQEQPSTAEAPPSKRKKGSGQAAAASKRAQGQQDGEKETGAGGSSLRPTLTARRRRAAKSAAGEKAE